MNRCEVCHNEYDNLLLIKDQKTGETHKFDSFECAIHKMAPVCEHCGIKVVGHGIEADGQMFCCGHCAREKGFHEVVDHVETEDVSAH